MEYKQIATGIAGGAILTLGAVNMGALVNDVSIAEAETYRKLEDGKVEIVIPQEPLTEITSTSELEKKLQSLQSRKQMNQLRRESIDKDDARTDAEIATLQARISEVKKLR